MFPNRLIDKILWVYGESQQVLICIEEMAELTKELLKTFRGKYDKDHLKEEVADVYVTLEYIKKIFGISNKEIEEIGLQKLYREEERINANKSV